MKNWELEWIKFVREVMCPARCGRLRFKVKKLIQGIRDKQKEEIVEMFQELDKWQLEYGTTNEGIAQAWNNLEKAVLRWKQILIDLK